ncbi:hypothetical protein CEF21_04715 [Bacillus sp. FJAT-42376]|uniref:host-nuclease inhibitor Gam family protein n=1 Tax=Bacillus sp. FJAT-42376 TaxID=2014076 RepID=UPI000F4F33BA|nr:host-nuclease inhibitor Gam family protein [Bacillus sp. FJAT-42376]AZB41655.1 hypothetical protein CEF21_04715 [Bacillus sp. FJAT-42376]
MSMENKVARYRAVSLQIKELESELGQLKEELHAYFDGRFGENQKGKAQIGDYVVQRQIRSTEAYTDDTLVARLEELRMEDCIRTVKKPDKEKIDAALTLGILSGEQLKGCILQKLSKALVVKEK